MNQYSVNPSALVSTVTPPVFAVFRTVVRLPPAGAGAGLPARATEMPNTTRAATDRPAPARPAPGTPARSPPRSPAGTPPAGGATPAGRPRVARAGATGTRSGTGPGGPPGSRGAAGRRPAANQPVGAGGTARRSSGRAVPSPCLRAGPGPVGPGRAPGRGRGSHGPTRTVTRAAISGIRGTCWLSTSSAISVWVDPGLSPAVDARIVFVQLIPIMPPMPIMPPVALSRLRCQWPYPSRFALPNSAQLALKFLMRTATVNDPETVAPGPRETIVIHGLPAAVTPASAGSGAAGA